MGNQNLVPSIVGLVFIIGIVVWSLMNPTTSGEIIADFIVNLIKSVFDFLMEGISWAHEIRG